MAKGKRPLQAGATDEAAKHTLESAIDNVDLLRVSLRKMGKTDCADALDDAFAICLRAYVDERGGRSIDSPPRRRRLVKRLN